MSRIHRVRRRAAHSILTHERARNLAAARLDEPLEPTKAAWLDEHLATCEGCRSVGAAYEADRLALRGLRDRQPEPPRDLWARTAAAIERESASRGRRSGRAAATRRWSALGAVVGVAAVAAVVGASVMNGRFPNGPSVAVVPDTTKPPVALLSPGPTPGATPIVVGAGSVGWIGTGANGALAYNVANVDEVCPAERQPDCAAVADRDSKPVSFAVRPKSISQSPVKNQAVVVGTDASGRDSLFVIALPTQTPSGAPTPTPSPTPRPTATSTPTATATSTPRTTPTPSPTARLTQPPIGTPTPTPSETPSETPTTSASPEVTPEPSVAVTLAIVSDVKVVGQSAAYSPDGAWFAFSARPSDDSTGPDIYVWRVGDLQAQRLTSDHASVFASWAGDRLLGSRPGVAASAPDESTAHSFFIDPTTGTETGLSGPEWRPIVDPTSHWAVAWDGTVKASADGLTSVPAAGSLVLRGFTPTVGLDAGDVAATLATDGSFAEFDVRWDETGQWLAIWLADASDPSMGRLSLLQLDPTTGEVTRPQGAPHDVRAMPGFSIANGRLAWATPPGQGGEGSRVQIVAWTDQAVGAVESGPVEDVVVVH